MIERLVEHALGLSEEEREDLTVQDIALCRVWYEGRNGDASAEVPGAEGIPALVDAWLAQPISDPLKTEGRRHQTLLRDLLGELQDARVGSLARDEVEFLIAVYTLAESAEDKQRCKRVHELLTPYIKVVKKRRGILKPVPGLDTLSEKLHVVKSEDILKSPSREVNILAGIELASRGPVLSHKGHVRVLGNVPENCTVVVEGGGCVVDGFVMGRVAATGICEVRKNISGVVIVGEGDVRAMNIVDNAYIVAKLGNVFCRGAENPTLVFAGNRIDIRGKANRGQYLAPSIEVEEEAIGGEFHITDWISAEYYRQSQHAPLRIIFRRRFTCRDYGQVPSREMRRRLSEAMRLRQRLNCAKELREMASEEAEQLAANALMFMLGGDDVKKILDDTLKAQGRINVLNRIILGFGSLYKLTQRSIESDGIDDEEEEAYTDDAMAQLEEAGQEEARESGNEDLAKEGAAILTMKIELQQVRSDRRKLTIMLGGVQERLAGWVKESKVLAQRIAQNEQLIQKQLNWERFTSEGNDATKLVMLRRILAATKKKDFDSPLRARMNSNYIRLMLRTIRLRLDTAASSRQSIHPLRTAFKAMSERIWDDFQVRIVEKEDDPLRGATARGRYETNIKLHSESPTLNSDQKPQEGTYFVTPASGDRVTTYACRSGSILEVVD